MKRQDRRKFVMGRRARDFFAQHPFPNAKDTEVVELLGELIAKVEALTGEERAGRIAVRMSTQRRKDLRRTLRANPLFHLGRTASVVAAAQQQPELVKLFQLPSKSVSHEVFLTAARKIFDEATARRDAFLAHGMADTLLDDLGAMLLEYEQSVKQANTGRATHTNARAEIEAVVDNIMLTVRQLDGLVAYRFANSPERRVAWASARNVGWPEVDAGLPGDKPAPSPQPAPGPSDGGTVAA